MIRSKTANLYEMMEFPSEGVFSKVVARGGMSNHTLMCLAKGTDISEHTSSREGTVTVLKGTGTFVLNGKKIRMEPGVCIFMPAKAPHALRADEDLAFLLSLSGKESKRG
ncbi:MAG: cupin domain-containing protein [Candidatus Aureabacteria bacterium]|nr:cupin domain-containing protein [Candidatus Auribacterota bacterium]NLW94416.1 cupin domain-containing protein [Chlamydiota bacterium]HOE27668.1 cupin domain-containing protein [bacterium]HQM52883.1 cupin domain-containing protein [bacterium]